MKKLFLSDVDQHDETEKPDKKKDVEEETLSLSEILGAVKKVR